jgi:hypothetical protein
MGGAKAIPIKMPSIFVTLFVASDIFHNDHSLNRDVEMMAIASLHPFYAGLPYNYCPLWVF